MRKFLLGLLVVAAAVAFWSCNLDQSDPGQDKQFVSLRLEDSLKHYDRLHITLKNAAGDSLDEVWNGPLADPKSMPKIEVSKYNKIEIDIVITGYQDGKPVYIRIIHFHTDGGTATTDSPTVPDYTPPVLHRNGPDSLVLYRGAAFVDSGTMCTDDRDIAPLLSVSGSVNTGVLGDYLLTYSCKDNAGNPAAPAHRKIKVIEKPDTTPPILAMTGPDTLILFPSQSYSGDTSVTCHDDRDGTLPVTITGTARMDVVGVYVLTFSCKDSAGNAAANRTRTIQIVNAPDKTLPVLTLKGSDSLVLFQSSSYVDSGATCLDDRDGNLSVTVKGSVMPGTAGEYTLEYGCADKAGNAAVAKRRKVDIVERPDVTAPVLTLKGPDSLTVLKAATYVDSGATCFDARDGALFPDVTGSVLANVLGSYDLTFTCKDKAGNAATPKHRQVHVVDPPDLTLPVITLNGAATILVTKNAAFSDPGAVCTDDRDGTRAVSISGAVDNSALGNYTLTYSCTDKAGNRAEVKRTVKVVAALSQTEYLSVKEASYDSGSYPTNNGNTFLHAFSNVGEHYVTAIAFDLASVNRTDMVSAIGRFKTFGWNTENWGTDSIPVTFKIYRMKKSWIEGNGNWYYHDGAYSNSGEIFLANYGGLPAAIRSRSTDPALHDGISSLDNDVFHPENVVQVGAPISAKVYFPPSKCVNGRNPKPIPGAADLVDFDIDLTEYIKTSPITGDYGFYVTVQGLPTNWFLAWVTKDVGDGTLGPKLIVNY